MIDFDLLRPSVPVEAVAEVYELVSEVPLASTRGASRVLQFPNYTILKILRSTLHMFPYRFQRIQMLQAGDKQQRLDFPNEYLMWYVEDDS